MFIFKQPELMLMGTFCNPAGQQQPRGSRLLSYLYEPVTEIIDLFKSADVTMMTANPAVSCTVVEVKDRNRVWNLPREGGESPAACGKHRCGERSTERAVEVTLHQEMAGAET